MIHKNSVQRLSPAATYHVLSQPRTRCHTGTMTTLQLLLQPGLPTVCYHFLQLGHNGQNVYQYQSLLLMKTRQSWYKQHHHLQSIIRQGATTSWRIHRPILMVHSLVTKLSILTSEFNFNNVTHLTCVSWRDWKSNSRSDCCFIGRRTIWL